MAERKRPVEEFRPKTTAGSFIRHHPIAQLAGARAFSDTLHNFPTSCLIARQDQLQAYPLKEVSQFVKDVPHYFSTVKCFRTNVPYHASPITGVLPSIHACRTAPRRYGLSSVRRCQPLLLALETAGAAANRNCAPRGSAGASIGASRPRGAQLRFAAVPAVSRARRRGGQRRTGERP